MLQILWVLNVQHEGSPDLERLEDVHYSQAADTRCSKKKGFQEVLKLMRKSRQDIHLSSTPRNNKEGSDS